MTTRFPRLILTILIGLDDVGAGRGLPGRRPGASTTHARPINSIGRTRPAAPSRPPSWLPIPRPTRSSPPYKSSSANAPTRPAATPCSAAAYLQKARKIGRPRLLHQGRRHPNRAFELNGDDTDALTSLGELALARHQFTEAISWGERSLAINSYKARTLGVIGDGQLELGRYDEAFATFQQMVDLRPDSRLMPASPMPGS